MLVWRSLLPGTRRLRRSLPAKPAMLWPLQKLPNGVGQFIPANGVAATGFRLKGGFWLKAICKLGTGKEGIFPEEGGKPLIKRRILP